MDQNTLLQELQDIEGLVKQHPETGKLTMTSYVNRYTNRVFGAPFQYLDSVDKRFENVNSHVGNEYLRNFLLNAPVLRIRPGMPKYTGGDSEGDLWDMIKKLYFGNNTSELSPAESLLQIVAKSTLFKVGKKLQRRMFGFRETYYDYMQYVNYMCRSCATYLYLTDGKKFPYGAFPSDESDMINFQNFKWENYRFLDGSEAKSPMDYLGGLLGHVADPIVRPLLSAIGATAGDQLAAINDSEMNRGFDNILDGFNIEDQIEFVNDLQFSGVIGQMGMKATTVDFMVEPDQSTEILTNNTSSSMIEQGVDALRESVGAEIGWISNSHADTGVIGGLLEFLGNGVSTISTKISDLGQNVTGGFVGGLFTGAVASVRGQKMIYPEIYKSSNSEMNKTFKVLLTTPYGDAYNYYMNILVPLMHLIALAAPRMVTANTVSSPFLVQCWIPGQYTCQLGIISNMTITKNPSGSGKVSVNGFPLEVEVSFTVKELYNAMSISPANDPASFLFNETLNDYLCNVSGLIPSEDTFTKQRQATFNALSEYITGGGILDDAANIISEKIENFVNPFAGR